MKKTLYSILMIAIGCLTLMSCGSTQQPQNNVSVYQSQQTPQNVSVQAENIPGFDIAAFSTLLKSTTNADALTQAINQTGNNINNLDLDNDNQIDYLKVDQINNNQLGVFDETPTGKINIATLTVNPQSNSYSVVGYPDYSGSNYTYQSPSGLTLGQFMFLSWMMSPRPMYHPFWGYHTGYYRGYSSYRTHYSSPYNSNYARTYKTRTITKTAPNTQVNRPTAQTPSQRSMVGNNKSQKVFSANEGQRFNANVNKTNAFAPKPQQNFAPKQQQRSFGGNSNKSFGGGGRSFGGGGRRK